MSETAANDGQELELIKQFWNRYKFVIFGLVIFFVVMLLGTNYWRSNRMTSAAQASQIFQEMVIAQIQNDSESAFAKAQQLQMEYSNTPYADFAGLLLAKEAVATGDIDKAITSLQSVIDHNASNNMVRNIATVRLASLLQQQGKLDEAFALVEKDPAQAYISLYAQTRGDIYVAKNEPLKAKNEYTIALQHLPIGVKSPVLQMKLFDLGSENAA